MSLADRIIPPEALRFDRARPLTRPWPELDLWTRANPAIGGRIDPIAVWDEFERSVTANPLPRVSLLSWRKRK